MISAKTYSRLLYTLYAASASPRLWHEFLRDLTQSLNLTGAAILHQDMEQEKYSMQYSYGFAAECGGLYQQYYGRLDAWRPRFLEKQEGEFALGGELCPAREIKTTEFYNDFLRKYDICLFGAVAAIKRPRQIELISLYQSWQGRSPGRSAADAMALIFPHVQSALNLRRRFVDLHACNNSLSSALDVFGSGVVVLDRAGNVVLMNRSAESLLKRGDGLVLRNRRLRADRAAESARLNALISRSVSAASGRETAPGGSVLISRTASRPLALTVYTLPASVALPAQNAAAVLFIHDPEQQVGIPADLLRQGYGLTPSEARLAIVLLEGHTLKESADSCGVTHNTAKSQLKSIF